MWSVGIASLTEGSAVFNVASTGAVTRLAAAEFIEGDVDGTDFRTVVALRVSRLLLPTAVPLSNDSIAESAASFATRRRSLRRMSACPSAGEPSRLEPASGDKTIAAASSGSASKIHGRRKEQQRAGCDPRFQIFGRRQPTATGPR